MTSSSSIAMRHQASMFYSSSSDSEAGSASEASESTSPLASRFTSSATSGVRSASFNSDWDMPMESLQQGGTKSFLSFCTDKLLQQQEPELFDLAAAVAGMSA
eukprot:GFYU01010480.1.p1 GENE.GFYU01010480.1~~GFYU01010480.1.p1  ORF type:complete len:103 (+),score=24.91 GFYU01010480.1:83-391(+)